MNTLQDTVLLRRHCLLEQLADAHPARLALGTLRAGAKLAGHTTDEPTLVKDLEKLIGESLCQQRTASPLSPARKFWHITPEGIEAL